MTIEIQNLPYAMDALKPFISKTTMEFHHGKHYSNYVKKLNELIVGTDFERMNLEEICVYEVEDGKIVSEQFFF